MNFTRKLRRAAPEELEPVRNSEKHDNELFIVKFAVAMRIGNCIKRSEMSYVRSHKRVALLRKRLRYNHRVILSFCNIDITRYKLTILRLLNICHTLLYISNIQTVTHLYGLLAI